MLAYEDESADALVLGHGVPMRWLEGDGITVRNLPTPFGRLAYTARRDGAAVVMLVEAGLRVPSGGVVVRLPPQSGRVSVDGRPITPAPDGAIVLRALPSHVRWSDR
jgi:hypothetical protein